MATTFEGYIIIVLERGFVNEVCPCMETICARLKSERLRLALTQEEMAAAGRVARSAQANYEKGDRSPDTQYLALIHAVGVDVGYVITGVLSASATDVLTPADAAVINKLKNMKEENRKAFERLIDAISGK